MLKNKQTEKKLFKRVLNKQLWLQSLNTFELRGAYIVQKNHV